MFIFPSDAFSLGYRAGLRLISGRWLKDLPPPELQKTYEVMLEAAQAHGNCRFWLLDLRRPVAGPDLNAWFRDQFSPGSAAVLNGQLFTVYLAGPQQRLAAASNEMELYCRRETEVDAFPQRKWSGGHGVATCPPGARRREAGLARLVLGRGYRASC